MKEDAKEAELFSSKTMSWNIPFNENCRGWSLSISRVQGMKDVGDKVVFGLHYNGKPHATHAVEGGVAEFRAMFRELGA